MDLFHLPTLLLVLAAGALAVSALLGLRLLGHARGPHMRLWAAAFAAAGIGALLQGLRGVAPTAMVIVVSNAFILAMITLLWAGFRAFDRRPAHPAAIAAGIVVWLAACTYPPFYVSFEARTILISVVLAVYSAAIARHTWRYHAREPLPSRPAIAVLFAAHVGITLSRIPLLYIWPVTVVNDVIQSRWIGAYIAESLIHAFLVIIAILALARDRTEREFRRAAETDALTGVANRRAFIAAAETALAEGRTGALLLIDLDHFKAINDTHGHQAGDDVLAGFAARASACLAGVAHRFGRIGGEEFAVFLPGLDALAAVDHAEFLRSAIAATAFQAGGQTLRISISIGVAPTEDCGGRFERLFAHADAALYRAKSAGRNRVRAHDPARRSAPLHVVGE